MTDAFTGNASILLLDSDPLTRTILHETLERGGYLVVAVDGLGAAVDRLKMMRPDLLIVRPYIGTMPGRMAAQYLRTLYSGLAVLSVDGCIDDERIHVQNTVHKFHMFPKPFAPVELLGKVREILRIVRGEAH
jgi:DNA-binding response OmpR family regulator